MSCNQHSLEARRREYALCDLINIQFRFHTNLKKCERLNHVSRYPVHPSSAAPHGTKFSKTYLNKERKVGILSTGFRFQ
ncbi:hypothetical protein ANCDUO_00188 [Ancylostoma duodenale]|uniref:Uncharacterized protein n=1 Tax=Ancylostoma duodenale TaxID=51022 RepID=A0A0C2HIP8_9BILA|nr:hypothetical protein ANCDUO_00188 [Ancylostoma duodenale]